MKKKLIALAAMAVSGIASAQSSVTLFGIVDATLAWGRGSVADRFQLATSGYNSSRIGFRGVEGLGGGMSASFHLEAGVNNDNGTGTATNVNNQATGGALAGMNGSQGLMFNRRSTVSLAGGWGEVRLGRDFTPQYNNHWTFDPFGNNGVGTSQVLNSIITGPTAVRASNSIAYLTPPNIGGFYSHVMYYLGENPKNGAATEDDGRGYGLRAGYASGPLHVSAAVSRTTYAAGNVGQNNLGASWHFGVAKVMGMIERDKNGTTKGRGWQLGAAVPVGVGEIRAAVSRYTTDLAAGSDPSTSKVSLGYVHNLSKRTAVYAAYAHVSNKEGATAALNGSTTGANSSSSGVDLGVRHSF